MGEDLFAAFPELTDHAGEVLGYPVDELCLKDPDGRLDDTCFVQPAVYFVNALAALDLAERGATYDVFAGHSLGEYNALVAAGCLDLMDGLRLVAERGRAMAQVRGGMAAVVGLGEARVQEVLALSGLTQVFVASLNSDEQIALGGRPADLDLACRALLDAGARSATRLKVSGPFHTPLMRPALAAFRGVLRAQRFTEGRHPVLSSTTGELLRVERAADVLARQLTSPVQWVRTVHGLRRLGVTRPDEVNGSTLQNLDKGIR